MQATKYDEGIDQTSPSLDKTGRFPKDALLRSRGFAIAERPKNGMAVWQRRGKKYRFSQAMCIASEELKGKTSEEE
jgi:hypothetical protein